MRVVFDLYDEHEERLMTSDPWDAADWADAMCNAYWFVRREDQRKMKLVCSVVVRVA